MGDHLNVNMQHRYVLWITLFVVIGAVLIGHLFFIRRISRKREKEKHLLQWMRIIVENAMDLILILDETDNIQHITSSITRFLQYTDEEVRGKPIMNYVHPEDRNRVMKGFRRGRKIEEAIEGRFLHKEGYYCYLSAQIKYLYDEKGKSAGAVISCQDITERKRMENRLSRLRFKDVLTGLNNRGYFEEKVKEYLKNANYPLSIIVGDVDGLKIINDTHGHLQGDLILENIGKVLKSNCRKEDLLCRIGGDEFVMLLPKTSKSEAEIVTKRIERDVSRLEKDVQSCSISLGFYTATEPAVSIESIMVHADKNMYKRKAQRKNVIEKVH